MNNKRDILLANHDIYHKTVRIVTEAGSQVLPINDALKQADSAGLDLIQINGSADPPICKIADLAKDGRILQHARDCALELLTKDPNLNHQDNQATLTYLKRISKNKVEWSKIS